MSEVLVIKSSEWLRGSGENASGLKLGDKYCCLGLDAKRCGYTDDDLMIVVSPYSLYIHGTSNNIDYIKRWLDSYQFNNESAEQAMIINDNIHTTDEEKIEQLRPIFARYGIEIDWRPDE